MAVFDFSSGVPGARLWPTAGGGYFFRPSGQTGHVWVEIPLGWTCAARAFIAAEEQVYNYPNCDPYAVDTNTVFRGHSWHYYRGSWTPVNLPPQYGPYRNVMLRVVVDDETVGVEGTSIGRVKALYY